MALIGTDPLGAAALSGSILLSNLPEAASGARQMSSGGRSKAVVMRLWTVTAVLPTAAALVGNLLMGGASESALALIRSFAGGAVIGSLAIGSRSSPRPSRTADTPPAWPSPWAWSWPCT